MKVRYLLIAVAVIFVAGMLANQSYAKIDPKTIVASWSFDEGSGTKVIDSSGNGCDGTITGAKWVDGMAKPSKALNFDGVGNLVLADIKGTVPQSLTLEAWIYPVAGGVVFAELGQGTANSGWHDSQMEVLSTGEIKVGFWSGAETGISLGTYKLNTWYYVVMTYDKDNKNTISGYVNGELKKTGSFVKQYPGDLWYAIGSADTTSLGEGKFFKGMIDKATVYNVALSADDVKQGFATTAVLPAGKMTTTWASIKDR